MAYRPTEKTMARKAEVRQRLLDAALALVGRGGFGALTMLAFGLGTSLSLLGVGVASSLAGAWMGRWSTRVAAVSITLAGAVILWRGLSGPHHHG